MADNAITKASPDYQKLVTLLTQVDTAKTTEIAADDQITQKEMVDLFDGDDGIFTLLDLNAPALRSSPKLFGQIEDIIGKFENGSMGLYYSLSEEERGQAVTNFCLTGKAFADSSYHTEASASLAYDSSFLSNVLYQDSKAARFIPFEMFEKNEWLPYQLIYNDPMALGMFPEEFLSKDSALSMTAAALNGDTLQFVSGDMQVKFPEIVQYALMETSSAFAFVVPEFQAAYPEIVRAMWGIIGDDAISDIAPEFWQADPMAIEIDWDGLRSRPMDLENSDSLMAWLTLDGMNLQYVPGEVQSANPEVVFAALLQNPEALRFTSGSYQVQNTSVVWATLSLVSEPMTYYLTPELQIAEKKELQNLLGQSRSLDFLAPELARVSPYTYYECVKETLKLNGAELEFVPKPYLAKHPELAQIALKADPRALRFTDAAWQIAHPLDTRLAVIESYGYLKKYSERLSSDIQESYKILSFLTPEFRAHHPKNTALAAAAAIKADPYALGELPQAYWDQHLDLVRMAVSENGCAIRHMSDGFQAVHPDMAYSAVEVSSYDRDGGHYSVLYDLGPSFLVAHPDVVWRAIRQDDRCVIAILKAGDDFLQGVSTEDLGLMRAALEATGGTNVDFENAEPSAIASAWNAALPEFLAQSFFTNVNVLADLKDVSSDVVAQMWEKVRLRADSEGFEFPTGVMDTPESFQSFMSGRTQFPERFRSLQTVHEVFVNGEDPTDTRPVALMLYNVADWNGAFVSRPVIDDIAEDGRFHVIYREIDSDDDVTAALKEFGPVHTLVLAGHGSKTTLSLGPEEKGESEEAASAKDVDTEDYQDCDEEKQSYFVPGGQILLYACSNGEGGAEDENLHHAVASSFPAISVVSSPQPSNIRRVWFDDKLQLHNELFHNANPVISSPFNNP